MSSVNVRIAGDTWVILKELSSQTNTSMQDIIQKAGPAGLVVVVPITTKDKNIPLHVQINPPEGGLKEISYAKCEDLRSISKARLIECYGKVSAKTMSAVEDRISILLGF